MSGCIVNYPIENECIRLLNADASEFDAFKLALQDAFRVSAEAEFGHALEQPIPSDDDIEQSFRTPGSVTYWIMFEGQRVGGAIVVIDELTGRNSLALFFIATRYQSRGFGLQAWKAIENTYPLTTVWQTATPYFEKRNIHFYVNLCGFKIVEFYHRYHPDPHLKSSHPSSQDEDDEMFRFEKCMVR